MLFPVSVTSLFAAQQQQQQGQVVPMEMGEAWAPGPLVAASNAGMEESWRSGSVASSLPFSGVPQPVMHSQQKRQ
jgi:hypothetical protein